VDIAKRVDLLFKTIKPGDREYSYRGVRERAGGAISSTAIWKVRKGQITNPSQRLLSALSRAFQVSVDFFSDEDVTEEDVSAYQEQYHSEQMVEQIALRASELDDEGKQVVLDMIDLVQNAQKMGISVSARGKE
jgi:transcriptional regulator with XRE-family HTH domain